MTHTDTDKVLIYTDIWFSVIRLQLGKVTSAMWLALRGRYISAGCTICSVKAAPSCVSIVMVPS